MSDMEFFHGYFEESDLNIEQRDEDDFYDLEQQNNCYYVNVEGTLYKLWHSDLDVDAYGFAVVAPPSERPQLMLYWYNGGAGIHEVAEDAIRRHKARLK